MKLNSKQIRFLRGLAHNLNCSVQMGKAGYGPSLVGEVERNLKNHELIKVRLGADDRDEFESLAELLSVETGAGLVQSIGRVAVYYREGEKPEIKLP
jgi:RNA-binding protein